MGFFSRSSNQPRAPLLTATPADLKRIGDVAFGGESIYPQGMSALPAGELDGYAMTFLAAATYPESGSPAFGQFIEQLASAAEVAGNWGFVGAILVGWNCVAGEHRQNPRYLTILDRGLEVLREDGVSYTSVPPFAMDRWQSLHGFDEAHPKGWPSPLTYLPVPSADAAPPVEGLARGESRRLAQAPAAPSNMIYGEGRPDGSIQAVMEGVNPETGQLRRWDWEGLTASDYPGFLRELGDRLVTHAYWAHDDLIPYFPCRQRSRDQMRIEARAAVL
jgi:hypothetical protein